MGYLPVRVSTLRPDIILGFDLFIELPHKHIKYFRGEDSIDSERLVSLKVKKVRKLYINDHDETRYQSYVDRCLEEMMVDENIPVKEKAFVVTNASEACVDRVYKNPHSAKNYYSAQKTANNLIGLLAKNDELLKEMFLLGRENEIDEIDTKMHKHAIHTSSLCIGFAEFLKKPQKEVELLAMAGLFHDVGFTQMNVEGKSLLLKRQEEMTMEELHLYREHPRLGAEILQDKEFANPELIDLIMHHEERKNGNGFPHKILKLSSLQEIIALCAYYDVEFTFFGKKQDEILEDLLVNQMGNFDLEFIQLFKRFMKKKGNI